MPKPQGWPFAATVVHDPDRIATAFAEKLILLWVDAVLDSINEKQRALATWADDGGSTFPQH